MKKLFVVGCPRSGTTVLQQALSRHSQIVIPPETSFFSNVFGRSRACQHAALRQINQDLEINLPLSREKVRNPDAIKQLYERLVQLYAERVRRQDATYFGEKTPRHLNHVYEIASLYPEAKIIVIIRDGRDVALSLTEVPWGPSTYYVNFARWLRDFDCYQKLVQDPSLAIERVRYEDFTANPHGTLERLTEFLELPFEPEMAKGDGKLQSIPAWEHGWKSRSVAEIDRTRVARWRKELSEEQIACVERWGGYALRSLGYELVTDGEHPLPRGFFARLRWQQFLWNAGAARRSLQRELAGTSADRRRKPPPKHDASASRDA